MNSTIPSNIAGAWIATKRELVSINQESRSLGLAYFHDAALSSLLDEKAQHLVFPTLVNAPAAPAPHSYRCFLWLKLANRNMRICTLIDVSDASIRSLQRPPPEALERIIDLLLSGLPLVNLEDHAVQGAETSPPPAPQ